MAMNWAEAKAHWMALGYNQEEFSRKLQAAFPGRQGLSASRLSRKAIVQEAVEPDVEQWIRSLSPRAGHQARFTAPSTGTSAPAQTAQATQTGANASQTPAQMPPPTVLQWSPSPALVVTVASLYLLNLVLFVLILNRLPPPRASDDRLNNNTTTPAPVQPEAARDQGGSGVRVPPQPLSTQARPPCPSRLDKVINGGCWSGPLPGEDPPCTEGHYEHKGGCYTPIAETRRPPPLPYSDDHLDGGQP